jgi:exodeoxyribonuclease VII large subunit
VLVYPTPVQGDAAKGEIARALALAGERAECDVLIVARGGGSLEDLWAFNEEIVARAIAASPIPVVSGVGHETDFTLADLAADLRAPTPSGAAELVVPDAADWRRRLLMLDRAMASALRRVQLQSAQTLDQLRRRLDRCHPGAVLARRGEQLGDLGQRLAGALRGRLAMEQLKAANLESRLAGGSPAVRLRMQQQLLVHGRLRLASAIRVQLERPRRQLAVLAASLQGVSPLQTLERGYAIVQDQRTGQVLRDAASLKAGDRVTARLARGAFTATVQETSD